MITLLSGSLILSILHAILPNHWLPVLAISQKEKWSLNETTRVTFIAGASHAGSTVLIGAILAAIGAGLSKSIESFTTYVTPALLVALGAFYVYQHNRHHHFHMHGNPDHAAKNRVILSLASAMFFSPCFEIEGYFLAAGAESIWLFVLLASVYAVVTVTGMVIWVRLAHRGLLKMNWHRLEHNAGIITGATLILTGVLTFVLR